MITLYGRDGRLVAGGPEILTDQALWVDLFTPTEEEERAVEALLGIDVPTREEMREIEVSSRLSRDGDVLTMTSSVLTNSTGPDPRNIDVTFILAKGYLVTVRYGTPQAIAGFMARLQRRHVPLTGAGEVLLTLTEALVDRIADVLERVAQDLDVVSRRIFHQPGPGRSRQRSSSRELEATLRSIGGGGDLQSRARETIMGLRRMVTFLPADQLSGVADAEGRLRIIGRDLQSLSEYADFLNNNITFLLDATLGMINIQQNNIIKLFSVMAVLLMPPTLVASIYGMNFHHMPELDLPWGYPMALGIMLVAALLPYWLFKRKGWF